MREPWQPLVSRLRNNTVDLKLKLKRTTGERVPEMTRPRPSVRPTGAKGVAGQICVTSMAHFHFQVTDDDVDLGEGREGNNETASCCNP